MTPGFRFGQYEIRRELGRGALGVVYEAFDTATRRIIALKVLQDAGAGRERFRREGLAASQLAHPGIAAVYDCRDPMPPGDERAGPPCLVTEFVAGVDLRSRLASRTRFTPTQVAQVMGQLLGALRYAHERGVIHGDLKPANVLLRENGRLKLTDFGIARIAGADPAQLGEATGTLAYLSPEKLAGAADDARADLYACGAILYELLTGEAPFAGTAAAIRQKILGQEPLPPSRLNPALPRALDAVLRKALAKRPDARYPDASAFEHALAGALFAETPPGRAGPEPDEPTPPQDAPPEIHASKAGLAIAVAVAAAALVAIAVGLSLPRFGTIDSENRRLAIAPSLTAARTPIGAAEAPAPPRPGAEAAAGPRTPQEVERLAWDHARAADSAAAYKAYVAAYPDGAYVKLAQVHLAVLAQHAHPAADPDPAPSAQP